MARRKKGKSYPPLFFFLLFLLQSLEIAVVLRYEKEEGATTIFAVAVRLLPKQQNPLSLAFAA